MKKTTAAFVLFLSFASFAAELTQFGDAPQAQLNPQQLKVLVWNVHKGSDSLFTLDYQRLADGQDLALLQEANLNGEIEDSLTSVRMGYTHAMSFRSLVGKVKMGVATGSVARAASSQRLLSPVREVRAATPKAILVQTFALRGRTEKLLVANVHAINFVPNNDFYKHMEQLAHAMVNHQGPMIVGGDFNTWNVERLQFVDRLFARLQLDRAPFPHGRKRFPNIGHLFGVQTGGELDQVYVRGLSIVRSTVRDEVTSSDHKPLEVELAVR